MAVGRICLDPPTTTARPTLTSLVLETSRRLGGGARVPLNLSAIPSASLFPGQIIGVRGVNASGSYLAVQEILLPQRLPCPDITASDVLGRGLRIIMASGPWGTDTGGWEGFEEICRIAQSESVDVLILVTTLSPTQPKDRSNGRWALFSMKHIQGSKMELSSSLLDTHRRWNPSSKSKSQLVYGILLIHKSYLFRM